MSRRLIGNLRTPADTPQAGTLRFIVADRNAPLQTVSGAQEFTVSASGDYDITLNNGNYTVQFNALNRFVDIGKIEIVDGPDTALTAILS